MKIERTGRNPIVFIFAVTRSVLQTDRSSARSPGDEVQGAVRAQQSDLANMSLLAAQRQCRESLRIFFGSQRCIGSSCTSSFELFFLFLYCFRG